MTTIIFGCKVCGLKDVSLDVPTRGTGQAMREWLAEVVSPAVWHRHRVLSLFCEAETMGTPMEVTVPGMVNDPDFMTVDPREREIGGEA